MAMAPSRITPAALRRGSVSRYLPRMSSVSAVLASLIWMLLVPACSCPRRAAERLAGADPVDDEAVVLRAPVRGEVEDIFLEVVAQRQIAAAGDHLVLFALRLRDDLA